MQQVGELWLGVWNPTAALTVSPLDAGFNMKCLSTQQFHLDFSLLKLRHPQWLNLWSFSRPMTSPEMFAFQDPIQRVVAMNEFGVSLHKYFFSPVLFHVGAPERRADVLCLKDGTDITVEQCDNDADTSIVREALAAASDGSVEVRAEDADVLVMLVHHSSDSHHPLFLTTSNGSYDVRKIKESLSETQKSYLLFCHTFTGFCEGDAAEYIDIFLDTEATKETVIQAGTAIFKYIYHGRDTTLGEIRYNMFSRKAAAGVIKPETLPPTEGAAAQHSLRAYLQTRDWILLQSMSLNPSDYGWTIGVHGYEPVPTLDPTDPEELLQFTSCNCHGDCSNRRCSCKKNGVTCISACGVCNGITCRNCSHDVVESEEDIDNDC
uniref:uncharacterized protein n=1 Tax=Myxine glutinosa TaxID=7769 RepID=UPI00358E0096